MKCILRWLKSFWFVSIALLICVALAGAYAVMRFYPQGGPEARWIVVALASAVWLLAVVLRQYQRVRAERNIESLVEREVDRSVMTGQHDETEYDALSRRLKQVIERLRTNRKAGGSGQAALSELPWYLVIGLPSSGKTSLLANSGLNANVVGGNVMSAQSGTQTCDWYFSPEAVMIDTAGRYITDDQAAEEFSDFLKLLRRQRRQAINGLVMVVSLPELLGMSPEERSSLASQLLDRATRYRKALSNLPPVYLFFSKADLLPGFEETFNGLNTEERQQPWGMTFSVDDIRQVGIRHVFPEKFMQLMEGLQGHVQRRAQEVGQAAENAMLRFPDYMAELRNVLSDFLAPFDATSTQDSVPTIRGVYFTSALQTDNRLPSILDEHVRTTFSLKEQGDGEWIDNDPGVRVSDRRYFITGVFRSVIFPDRYLSHYIAKGGRFQALSPWTLGAGLLVGSAAIAAGTTSYVHHHRALTHFNDALTQHALSPEARLNVLGDRLRQFKQGNLSPVPFDHELGIDPSYRVKPLVEEAYFTGLKEQALMPVAQYLVARLHQLDELALATQAAVEAQQQATPRTMRNRQAAKRVEQHLRETQQRAHERLTQSQGVGNVTSLSDVRSQVRSQTLGRVQDAVSGVRSDVHQSIGNGQQNLRDASIKALRNGAHQQNEETGESVNPALSRALQDNRLTPEQVAQLDESYSALKLYLILAEPQKHHTPEDVRFVDDTLPDVWKAVAQQNENAISDDSIQGNVALYTDYLAQGRAPALGRDEIAVEQARASLKAFLNNQSLVDRKYLEFQQEARLRYPSLTLASIIPDNSRQLLYSGESVPSIYTRKVWDEYLRHAILDAAASDLHVDTDWVLDDSGSTERMESKTTFVRQLMARYKHDYINAWERFLKATGVRRFDSMDTANNRLAQLSDAQRSPIRQMMMAVRDNTHWDAPLDEATLAQAGQDSRGFWGKAMDVFSSTDGRDAQSRMRQVSDLPGFHDGVLASYFAQISALFDSKGDSNAGGEPIMDRYLRELRQMKVRFDNMRRAQDVGKASKQLVSETLTNGNTEFTVIRNDIAANIDVSDAPLSQAVQRVFSDPVEHAWETLYAPAGQQLARAWDARVDTPWRQKIADRYPLANTGNEGSIRDLRDFVDPNTGRFAAFNREEVGALGEGDANNALVDPRMQETIRNGLALGTVLDSLADPQNGFEVMIEPSPNMTQIVLTLDGQVQDYRNGPQPWQRFTWPGKEQQPGARLEVTTLDSQHYTIANFPTRWGLLRLIETSTVQDVDAVRQRFTWQTPAGPVSFVVRNFGGIRLTDLKKVHSLVMPRSNVSQAPAAKPPAEDEAGSSVTDEVLNKATEATTNMATDAASKAADTALKGVIGGQP